MADQDTSRAPAATSDRDQAIESWEQQMKRPMMAESARRQQIGGGLAVLAVVALGLVWAFSQSGASPKKVSPEGEIRIAQRQPVPKLNDPPERVEVPAASAPAPAAASVPAAVSDASANAGLLAQQRLATLQREESERKLLEARLKSSIVAPNNLAGSPSVAAGSSEPGNLAGAVSAGERGAQDANSRYARTVSGAGVAVSRASQLADLEYKILPGKLIDAVLEPRAVSDLPGTLCAAVSRDVYGSQGRQALIPWGSRVCGSYNADLKKGQARLFAIWNEVWLPDGTHVTIDAPGADQLGTAGMGGSVDTHFAQIFGVSALLSIIGAGASNVGVGSGSQNNSAAYYRESVQQAAANTSQSVLQPYVSIAPTVTVPHGSRVRIYVNRVLDFTDSYKEQIEAARNDGVVFIR